MPSEPVRDLPRTPRVLVVTGGSKIGSSRDFEIIELLLVCWEGYWGQLFLNMVFV